MNISLEQLKVNVSLLDKDIKKHFKIEEQNNRQLITDGIVNLEEYYNSHIKIMWILKEPYCDKNNGGGGWSLIKNLNDERAIGKKTDCQSTWHPISYTTYGILNEFVKFEKMPTIAANKLIQMSLRKIAFINVQKLPGLTRTSDAQLKKYYNNNKEILLRQIEVYQPDIIIGGKTLQLLKPDLNISKKEELKLGHFAKGKQLFINTLHPAQTKISRAEYVNTIVERAKQYKNIYS